MLLCNACSIKWKKVMKKQATADAAHGSHSESRLDRIKGTLYGCDSKQRSFERKRLWSNALPHVYDRTGN